jgi:hypothetical protein
MVGQHPKSASKLSVSEFECGVLGIVGLALKLLRYLYVLVNLLLHFREDSSTPAARNMVSALTLILHLC